jgi:hypothetical protein
MSKPARLERIASHLPSPSLLIDNLGKMLAYIRRPE